MPANQDDLEMTRLRSPQPDPDGFDGQDDLDIARVFRGPSSGAKTANAPTDAAPTSGIQSNSGAGLEDDDVTRLASDPVVVEHEVIEWVDDETIKSTDWLGADLRMPDESERSVLTNQAQARYHQSSSLNAGQARYESSNLNDDSLPEFEWPDPEDVVEFVESSGGEQVISAANAVSIADVAAAAGVSEGGAAVTIGPVTHGIADGGTQAQGISTYGGTPVESAQMGAAQPGEQYSAAEPGEVQAQQTPATRYSEDVRFSEHGEYSENGLVDSMPVDSAPVDAEQVGPGQLGPDLVGTVHSDGAQTDSAQSDAAEDDDPEADDPEADAESDSELEPNGLELPDDFDYARVLNAPTGPAGGVRTDGSFSINPQDLMRARDEWTSVSEELAAVSAGINDAMDTGLRFGMVDHVRSSFLAAREVGETHAAQAAAELGQAADTMRLTRDHYVFAEAENLAAVRQIGGQP